MQKTQILLRVGLAPKRRFWSEKRFCSEKRFWSIRTEKDGPKSHIRTVNQSRDRKDYKFYHTFWDQSLTMTHNVVKFSFR